MNKTRFCPTIELERMRVPIYNQLNQLKMTLIPAIDEYGDKAKPTIVEANIIGVSTDDTDKVVYDGVQGDLGCLMITNNDSSGTNSTNIDKNGELIISLLDDNVDLYSRSKENAQGEYGQYLMYNDL